MRRGRWVIVLGGLAGALAIAAACTGEDPAFFDKNSGDGGNCGRVACIGRCGSIVDECGQAQNCEGCAFGECSDAGFCTCPQPPSVACGDKLCGTAINACGQTVPCGLNGGACAPGDVCTADGGTCCTPDNVSACSGKCGGTAVNNCGETITCSTCAGAPGAVCLTDTKACCTPEADWCDKRCGSTKDNCGQPIECGGCSAGVTCTASNACGCEAEPKTKTCGSHVCGSQKNNCGQSIACGPNDTTPCAKAGDVCQPDGTCCTPKSDQETCAGRCGSVMNNCGTAVNCGNACPTLCGKGSVGPTTCCVPNCGGVVCEANDPSCAVKCAEATSNCSKGTRFVLSYADLNALSGKNCANTSAAINDGECFTAVKRYCERKGWAAGWFVANGADLQVLCVGGPSALESTTTATLQSFHGGCSNPSLWASGACVAAADAFCITKGYAGGLGVTELGGVYNTDPIEVMCLKGTYVIRQEVNPVTECNDISTGSCYTAVDHICYERFGQRSGANAVQNGAGKMQIMCVKVP